MKAATLGCLMDEVYRRAGFDGRLQAEGEALLALPPPEASVEAAPLSKTLDDEILF